MLRKLIAAVSILLLAFGVTSVVGGAAQAHTGDLNATAVCQADGTYKVTYKLTTAQTSLTGTTYWKIGTTTFEGTPTSNAGLTNGPLTTTGSQVVTLGSITLPGSSTQAPWAYAYTKWSDNYKVGSDGGDIRLAGDCKPPKPPKETGKEPKVTQVCVEPKNGTATKTSYERTWTIEYTWNNTTKQWVAGAKQYGNWVQVGSPTTVDDSSCRPTKPPSEQGSEPKVTQVCVDPANGTATKTTYTRTWTIDYSWNNTTHKWEAGPKVYGEWTKTGQTTVDDDSCIPTKPPTDRGSEPKVTQICVEPNNGTATKTNYSRTWTIDYNWNGTTKKWDAGPKVYSEWTQTGQTTVDDDSCIPVKPPKERGSDPKTVQVCVEPNNGTATTTNYSRSWTIEYSWSWASHTWVAGAKQYGDWVQVGDPLTVDDDSCIPVKPPKENGKVERTTQECIEPLGGEATKTTYATLWTIDYTWNATTHQWVAGEKVYGQEFVKSTETVKDATCWPPPNIDASLIAPVCDAGAPYLGLDVVLNDPGDYSTDDGTVDLKFWDEGGNVHWIYDVELDDALNAEILWPGASVSGGVPTGWPGWAYEGGTWVNVGDANFGWTREGAHVTVYFNPEKTFDLVYPPATWECDGPPPPQYVCEYTEGSDWGHKATYEYGEVVPEGAIPWVDGSECTPDVCPNIDGPQPKVPSGLVLYDDEQRAKCAVPPSLEGTVLNKQCIDDVPWVYWEVKLLDPDDVSTDDGTATITFSIPGHPELTYVEVVELDPDGDGILKGQFLWPGASATDNGDGTWTATGWPGWALIDSKWVSIGDENYGWTRNGVTVTIEVNPTMVFNLAYPPATPACVAGPPTEVHDELDAPPAEAVEAEAQYAG